MKIRVVFTAAILSSGLCGLCFGVQPSRPSSTQESGISKKDSNTLSVSKNKAVRSSSVDILVPASLDANVKGPGGAHTARRTWGYVNQKGDRVLPFEWDLAEYFSEGLAPVKKDEKWGFIDRSGKVIIKIQWDVAWHFKDGVGRVKKDGKWVSVNHSGNIVTDPTIESNELSVIQSFVHKKLDLINHDKTQRTCLDILRGVTPWDRNGNWEIVRRSTQEALSSNWQNIRAFSEGFAAVKKAGKWGFIDSSGDVVIPLQWDDVRRFSEGLAGVMKDGKWGFINTSGEVAIPIAWDHVYHFKEKFVEVEKNRKWGVIDQLGNIVIPLEWDIAYLCDNGLVEVSRDGKYGFIDRSGKIAIPIQWDSSRIFEGEFTTVQKEGKWGAIDVSGKIVIPLDWDNIQIIKDRDASFFVCYQGAGESTNDEKHQHRFVFNSKGQRIWSSTGFTRM